MKNILHLAKVAVVPNCFLHGDEVEVAHVIKPVVWFGVACVALGTLASKMAE